MPSIFDNLFGRQAYGPVLPGMQPVDRQSSSNDPFQPSPSILDDTPSTRDLLMGISQGLLSAGGPSPYPIDIGSALAKGLSGGLSAAEAGQDKNLKRALVTSQVQKAQSDIANDKAWQDMFKTPAAAATPSVSPVTPPVGAPTPLTGGTASATPPADWEPHYQTASAATGLSVPLLKTITGIESGNNPNAVSPAGAVGPAQLMPGTAADLGVTNSRDPGQAIAGGARYLKQQYDKYKDVDKALMAYNWGPGNVDAWVAAGSDPTKVPLETQQYVAKVKAGLSAAPGSPGPVAQPPVQMAGAPGMPAQGDAAPAAGLQMAQATPAAPAAKTLPQVIQSLPPAVRQMMGAMPRKDALPLLMKYADPETHVAVDTQTGAIVFAPKNDNSGRYQPVDAMKLDIEKQNALSNARQAAAREESNRIRGANEPMQPPMVSGGTPTPTPGYAEQKGAVSREEAAAKVGPALVQHQGELVIKDSQAAQVAADHARTGIANLSRLGALLDNVNTGKFQGTVQDLKASAKAAGVDLDALGVGDNVGIAQAAKALTGQLALGLRDPSGGSGMPGAMSDKDREFLVAMVPAITNDPNGNKLMLEWQKKLYQRNIEVAKIVNDYGRSPEFLKDPTGVYAKVREYADSHPLFDPEKDAPKAPTGSAGPQGSLAVPAMNAIDAEIARRRKAGGQ